MINCELLVSSICTHQREDNRQMVPQTQLVIRDSRPIFTCVTILSMKGESLTYMANPERQLPLKTSPLYGEPVGKVLLNSVNPPEHASVTGQLAGLGVQLLY